MFESRLLHLRKVMSLCIKSADLFTFEKSDFRYFYYGLFFVLCLIMLSVFKIFFFSDYLLTFIPSSMHP